MSTLCFQEGNFQPLWKVKGLERYTSWKVRVPDCVFLEKYEHRHVHIHIHIHIKITIHFQIRVHNLIHVYVHVRVHMHVRVRVCVCVFFVFFVVWCRVMSCAARCWLLVGWCGVVWCGGPCPWSFLLRMMSILQRARGERSMIERRVGQYMECVCCPRPFLKIGKIQGFLW